MSTCASAVPAWGIAIICAGMLAGPVASAAQAPPATVLAPTFSDVAPILYAKCIGCHRDGEAGPMSLVTFREVQPYAHSIRERLLESRMPPWHTEPKYNVTPSRRLTRTEMDTIVRWVDGGAREGDPTRLPPLPPPLPRR